MNRFLPIEWHDELPSTNTYLVERVRENTALPSGVVVAARAQSAGRGRQGRPWQTEANCNLTFSFLWNVPVAADRIPSMAQAIALGIAFYLDGEGIAPSIKWPNDVLVDGKKIAGILCETVVAGRAQAIVAGIGLNVNMNAEEAAAIDQPATSLSLELGHSREVDEVLQGLLRSLEAPLQRWSSGGFPAFSRSYAERTVPTGTRISVRDGDKKVAVCFESYTELGALRVRYPDGTLHTLYSGDLSLDAGVE